MPQLDASTFWGIIGIIVGPIVSIAFYIAGRKRLLLQYKFFSTELVANGTSIMPGLDITFHGEVVSNLTMTKIEIYNHGNCTISPSDFSSTDPLGLATTGNIVSYRIDNNSAHKEYMTPFLYCAQGKAKIEFDFLKPKDSLAITVLHSGEISVSGELKTGLFQKYYATFEKIVMKINRVLGNAFLASVIAGVISCVIFEMLCLIVRTLFNLLKMF